MDNEETNDGWWLLGLTDHPFNLERGQGRRKMIRGRGGRTNCTQVVIYSMTRRVCWPWKGQMQCKLWRDQQRDKRCWRKQSSVEVEKLFCEFSFFGSLFDGVFFSFNALDTCHHRSRDSGLWNSPNSYKLSPVHASQTVPSLTYFVNSAKQMVTNA